MSDAAADGSGRLDYYEILQINPSAEPETIHRVFRLLAQQLHPDNQDTGDEVRFHALHKAYKTLSDPEKRARYDIQYDEWRKKRWRLLSQETSASNDFDVQQATRLTVLEILYAQRRSDVNNPGVFILDLEDMTGSPREHLEFTMWYLARKGLINRGDSAKISITVEGVDHLEDHLREGLQRRRLKPPKDQD
jgi:curved DNA-binding protein CbpA